MKEDVKGKKFLVGYFNGYIMRDDRTMMQQFNEPERIFDHFEIHQMNIDKSIMVLSIIDKLPPSWKDFKYSLKHKKEDLSLEELLFLFD